MSAPRRRYIAPEHGRISGRSGEACVNRLRRYDREGPLIEGVHHELLSGDAKGKFGFR
jgi:hypothetical protein